MPALMEKFCDNEYLSPRYNADSSACSCCTEFVCTSDLDRPVKAYPDVNW